MSEVIDAERFPRLAARMQLKVPKEKVAQIHEFATDLAVGYDEGVWGSEALVSTHPLRRDAWHFNKGGETFEKFYEEKWGDNAPRFYSLYTMRYLTHLTGDTYGLTERALRLVDEPVTPPNVFISYKRSESSAFALLLEARIKYETSATPFLDKSIELGDDWHARLEERIQASRAFICVMAPTTLDEREDGSKSYVLREIEWALASEKTDLIIPVWHHSYDGEHPNDIIKRKNAELIESESAKNYDSAVNQILNRLGFSTQFIITQHQTT